MINYSELSKPQKELFDAMSSGAELRYAGGNFILNNHTIRPSTPRSLIKRHFITECFCDKEIIYQTNKEVTK
jgi:hypothetical protein